MKKFKVKKTEEYFAYRILKNDKIYKKNIFKKNKFDELLKLLKPLNSEFYNDLKIWLVLLVFLGFHSLCWEPISRLVFPIIPLILATGWSSLHLLFGFFFGSYHFGLVLRKMAIFILALAVFWQSGQEIHRSSQKDGHPYRESG